MTDAKPPATIKITANFFKDRMKKIKPFWSTEKTRYYLCGVYFEYDGEAMKATATNGHILCQMTIDIEHDNGIPFAVICPKSAIENLSKILGKSGSFTMHVSPDGKIIRFDMADHEYSTNTIDGNFPDYSRVIPKGSHSMREGINAQYLHDCLKALGDVPVDISVDDKEQSASVAHLLTSQKAKGITCVVMPMTV